MSELMSQRDLDFLLYQVFDAESLTKLERYKDHDRSTFQSVIELSKKIAENYYLPHNAKADMYEPQFKDGKVGTIEEVKTAWNMYAESGLLGCKNSYDAGGMQLPSLIHTACISYLTAANPSTIAYSFLTEAAANVIQAFASETLKNKYMNKMYAGDYAGTMALTEPDVGSSLGDLAAQAIPTNENHYLISGRKVYISGGDQDITDNIVHLVLARTKGAPAGVKGISLFVVPKIRVNEDGSLGEKNDVETSGLFHKMGYRGTTSTLLNFGENNSCHGYLIGEENKGLFYMFQMMNEARVGVGVGASMIGHRGYLASLKYAKERTQGRKPSEKNSSSPPLSIIEHSDVKRMLLAQKSYVEGSFALCLFAAKLIDESEANEDEQSAQLLDLLTPIVKSFPSFYGPMANDLAIQVLGGAGYTREFPVEQCYRDNRLNPIHEGTHGIQSLDLLGRKLWQHDGKALYLLMEKVKVTLSKAIEKKALAPLVKTYESHLKTFTETTQILGVTLKKGDIDIALANSSLYLDMMGRVVVSWLWIEMADKAIDGFEQSKNDDDKSFMHGKIQAAKYYINWELPQVAHQSHVLKSLDTTCLEMQANWF